jgi:UDP-2,4-diacetamido-2,4,6-trideoxy-beta-L-altropyranose hydrolase
MKVIILTETGPRIGLGHISRCLSLAYAFKERNQFIKIIIKGPVVKNIKEIEEFDHAFINWIDNSETALKLIDGYDIGVFDSYNISEHFLRCLAHHSIFPVFIDDLGRNDYPRGVIINSAIENPDPIHLRNPELYPLVGLKHVMLKREYWNNPQKVLRAEINTVLITMGATDNQNMTPWIITQLRKYDNALKMKIVITPFYHYKKKIYKIIDEKCEIITSPTTTEMKNLMEISDLAITAGGQTSFELVSMEVPSIIIITTINQVNNARFLAKHNIALLSSRWDDHELADKFHQVFMDIQSVALREKLIANGVKYLCPDGSRTIIKKIFDILITKRALNTKQYSNL